MRACALLLAPLMLAGCGTGGNSTITLNGEDGNVSIVTDADGHTIVKAPGVTVSGNLPNLNLEGDMQVSGIKLYPGSKVREFNLDASDNGGAEKGRVVVGFEAPAALDKVQAWFRDAMAKRKFKVAPQGTGFAGTTDDGQPVTLELTADGDAKTAGKMTIGA